MSDSSDNTQNNVFAASFMDKLPAIATTYALKYGAAALAALASFSRETNSDPWLVVALISGSAWLSLYVIAFFLSYIQGMMMMLIIVSGGGFVVRRANVDWAVLVGLNSDEGTEVKGKTKKHIEQMEGLEQDLRVMVRRNEDREEHDGNIPGGWRVHESIRIGIDGDS